MKFKKIFICLSLGCLSLQTYAQSIETKSDTTLTSIKDTLKKKNVTFKRHSLISVGIINTNNSFINNGIDFSYNILFHSNKIKKQYVEFGIGYDFQFYKLNTNNLLYANNDSLWFNNTGVQLKSNSLNLFYITVPIIYRNTTMKHIAFEIGMSNKFLVLQENLYRQNTPYTTVMTENMYQNTKFNKYQADVFVRVQLYKMLFIEARQSLTQVSGYSNFSGRPNSISVGIKL